MHTLKLYPSVTENQRAPGAGRYIALLVPVFSAATRAEETALLNNSEQCWARLSVRSIHYFVSDGWDRVTYCPSLVFCCLLSVAVLSALGGRAVCSRWPCCLLSVVALSALGGRAVCSRWPCCPLSVAVLSALGGRAVCSRWPCCLLSVAVLSALGGRAVCSRWPRCPLSVAVLSALGGRAVRSRWPCCLLSVAVLSALGGRAVCSRWPRCLLSVAALSALGGRAVCSRWPRCLLSVAALSALVSQNGWLRNPLTFHGDNSNQPASVRLAVTGVSGGAWCERPVPGERSTCLSARRLRDRVTCH